MIQLIQEIRDRGDLHLILSSHLLRDVEECCDEVLILKDGSIAAICNLEEERRANRRFLELETRGGNGGFLEAIERLGCEAAVRRSGPHQAGAAGGRRGAPALRAGRRAAGADPPPQPQARFARRHLPESHGGAQWPSIRRPTALRRRRSLPAWSRVPDHLPRYAFEDMHRSRFLSMFFLGSMLYPLVCALLIYVNQNLNFLKLLPGAPKKASCTSTSPSSCTSLGVQSMLAFFLTAFVGPGPGFAGPGQQRAAAVPGAAVFARRIRARQDVGAG